MVFSVFLPVFCPYSTESQNTQNTDRIRTMYSGGQNTPYSLRILCILFWWTEYRILSKKTEYRQNTDRIRTEYRDNKKSDCDNKKYSSLLTPPQSAWGCPWGLRLRPVPPPRACRRGHALSNWCG